MSSQAGRDAISSEARKILAKHPDRVPVICVPEHNLSPDVPSDLRALLLKRKLLIPGRTVVKDFKDVVFAQLANLVAEAERVDWQVQLRLPVENMIEQPSPGLFMMDLYSEYRCADGFLYVTILVRQRSVTSQQSEIKKDPEAQKLLTKYPTRVPAICKSLGSLPNIGSKKFLIPRSMSCGEFEKEVRTALAKADSTWATTQDEIILRLFAQGECMLDTAAIIENVYAEHGAPDGFLYLSAAEKNFFNTERSTVESESGTQASADAEATKDGDAISKRSASPPAEYIGGAEATKADEVNEPCDEPTDGKKEEAKVEKDGKLPEENQRNEGTTLVANLVQTATLEVAVAAEACAEDNDGDFSQRAPHVDLNLKERQCVPTESEAAQSSASPTSCPQTAPPLPSLNLDAAAPQSSETVAQNPEVAVPASSSTAPAEKTTSTVPSMMPSLQTSPRPLQQPSSESASSVTTPSHGATSEAKPLVPLPVGQPSTSTEQKQSVIDNYPDRVPVICEPAPLSDVPKIQRGRFLVPGSMLCSEFKYIIHKYVSQASKGHSRAAERTIYLFVGRSQQAPKGSASMREIFERHQASDGFLYVTYSAENTLG